MGKTGGYEAHMTFDKEHHRQVEDEASPNFVYSVITGCPLLGSGTYCYLTAYSKDRPEELLDLMDVTSVRLAARGVPTLRSKIEHIVYDTKTGVNDLD